VRQFELNHVGRLVALLDDKVKIVFITHDPQDPLLQTALSYLNRSSRNPKAMKRCYVLCPETYSKLSPTCPLSIALSTSMKTLKKIHDILHEEEDAIYPPIISPVIVPWWSDQYIVRIASHLKIPALALPLPTQIHYSTRSGFFELMGAALEIVPNYPIKLPSDEVVDRAQACFGVSAEFQPAAPHKCNIQEEEVIWRTLSQFLLEHPSVSSWMLKIKDEVGRRGVAIFHRKRLMFSISKFDQFQIMYKIQCMPEAFTFMDPVIPKPPARPPTAHHEFLDRLKHGKAHQQPLESKPIKSRKASAESAWSLSPYSSITAFFSSFCKTGGTIEAMLPGSAWDRLFVGCHLELYPTGELRILSTWENVRIQHFLVSRLYISRKCAHLWDEILCRFHWVSSTIALL
jgi:hypothetical protein